MIYANPVSETKGLFLIALDDVLKSLFERPLSVFHEFLTVPHIDSFQLTSLHTQLGRPLRIRSRLSSRVGRCVTQTRLPS